MLVLRTSIIEVTGFYTLCLYVNLAKNEFKEIISEENINLSLRDMEASMEMAN